MAVSQERHDVDLELATYEDHTEENAMGWLHDLLHGESDHDSKSIPVIPNPDHQTPPPLPDLGSQDPAAAHKRGYASKVCPSCEVPVKPLPRTTVICDACGEPIVVKSGEDGQWHLLREADVSAFEEGQEQERDERAKVDQQALLEAGFLSGDLQVDVVGESDYQEELKGLAGEPSSYGAMKEVIALLSREPDHPHEKNAVRIDVGSETVGYVEKWNAKQIQPLMQKLEKAGRPAWVRAWIVGGWKDDHGDTNYRVRLDSLPKVS
jgi:uncharacterized protein YidB (DUF937 family)